VDLNSRESPKFLGLGSIFDESKPNYGLCVDIALDFLR
jgi:hypothetical protein